LHHYLYEYLSAIHDADSTFLFRTRRQTDARFKKGYWFLGDSETIRLTFWETVGQKSNRAAIQLVYRIESQKWVCEIGAGGRETDSKSAYWEQMVQHLGGFVKKKEVWIQELGHQTDFLNPLHRFIQKEKPRMDASLKANPSFGILDFISIKAFEKEKEGIDTVKEMFVSDEHSEFINYLKADFGLCNQRNMKALPFALSRLHVSNFQGIKNLTIEAIPLNAQWVFLTGENASGKTSILKAIAKGLVGDEDFVEPLPTESRIYINGYNWNQPFCYEARPKKKAANDFQIAAYGVSRFQPNSVDQMQQTAGKVAQQTYSLFYDDGLLMNIERVLIDTERDDLPRFNRLKEIFLTIIPNLADLKSELDADKKRRIRYYEKSDAGKLYPSVLLPELAAGYRGILMMIGDMIQRLSKHPKNSLADLQGIVLIDEMDAHLHPKYQYQLPRLLSELFPKIQFMVTTHSPIPLLSLPKKIPSVVLVVSRTVEAGVTVERKDDEIEIHRLNPSALLTSPIFGFEQVLQFEPTEPKPIPTDNYEDIIFIQKMRKQFEVLREQGTLK
jgi:predicted ATPase